MLVFDWEMAGWGLPGVDLPSVDLPAYAGAVCADWPQLDATALARCLQLGNLLRGGIAATRWAAESLDTPWPHHSISNFSHYQRRIVQALTALGLRTTAGIP